MNTFFFLIFALCLTNALAVTDSCKQEFQNEMLKGHNDYRANHNAQNLVLNAAISQTAQQYAEFLAANNLFQHSNAAGLGENLALFQSSNLGSCKQLARIFIDGWYQEVKLYNFNNPGFSSGKIRSNFVILI